MFNIKICNAVIGDSQLVITIKQVGNCITQPMLKQMPHDN